MAELSSNNKDSSSLNRCEWCTNDALYIDYHDKEWGVPLHDDRRLFEMLILEGAQAGLSWLTILKKREHYRRALENFDAVKIANYGEDEITRLMSDPGIVRNRLKIESVIRNARAALQIKETHGTLDSYFWRFVDGVPRTNHWRSLKEIPPTSAESISMSKDLKSLGCNFVGPTICYAFMQATGLVNDHTIDCFRYREILAENK